MGAVTKEEDSIKEEMFGLLIKQHFYMHVLSGPKICVYGIEECKAF